MKIKIKLQMEKKPFLIMVAIVFLVLIVNIASAGVWDDFLNLFSNEKTIDDLTNDDVFKELILNDAVKTESIIKFKNPIETNIERRNIKVNFIQECGFVDDYKLLINSTCDAERIKEQIFDTREVCYNSSIIDNKTFKNITKETCFNESFIKNTIYENYTYNCFKEFEKINAGDLRNIKLDADISFDTCSDGSFGYKIDWQMQVILDDGIDIKILDKKDWAWWNITYDYKRGINCSNIDDKVPIVVNGSDGFTIDGKKQIVWTYCDGIGTSLYYNDYLDYVVANDTTQLPFEVEFGNGTSYNPTSVWTNYYMVQHLNDATTSTVNDSVSNIVGTKLGVNEPIEIDGKIGKAQDFDGSNDKITYTQTSNVSWSLSHWFKIDTIDHHMAWSSVTTQYQYWNFIDDTHIDFYMGASNNLVVSSLGTTWHHVVMTMDSCSAKIYLDGAEIDTETYTSDCNLGAETYTIGNWNVAGTYEWDGQIDEFRVSDNIRSATYINQSYQNAIGTFGYGDLGILESVSLDYILNGTIKDSNNVLVNNATIIIIDQSDNTITGTTESNSTGGWIYNLGSATGTYLIVAYDPNNSTRDGDADPHIVVS